MTEDTLPQMPEPFDYCYEWDGPYGTRKFSIAAHNGRKCDRSVPIYTADQLRAYAAQAVAQERERCARICDSAADVAYAWWKARADPNDQGAAHKAEELADAIRAGSPSPQPAPAGWRLVPEEATEAMIHAGWFHGSEGSGIQDLDEAYRAMLAAAPQPPSAWRPISEAPEGEEILILGRDGSRCAALFTRESYGIWWQPIGFGGHDWEWAWETVSEPWRGVTHWQPLPPPPSAGEEKTA